MAKLDILKIGEVLKDFTGKKLKDHHGDLIKFNLKLVL